MGRLILALALAVLLAAVVVACGGSTSDASTTAPAPVATEATPAATSTPAGPSTGEVAALYADNCAGCHGADGSGGSAPAVNGEDDLAKVKTQIENGGGPMPAFSGQLSPGQIDALAQFVAGGLQ
jgi:mono/diheme cytochrome c family protein